MTAAESGTREKIYEVDELTRVEGEGSLVLHVRKGKVLEARLRIFEAPRYFEQIVVERTPDEVIDIVARICGICPVAYQMSAVHAFEDLFGVKVDPEVRALRRLLYCGEWIESHALHIYLLHLPDFLGYDSAIALAHDDRPAVERGLRMKKIGNRILEILGGRPIHPVSVRVGGFSRAPRRADLEPLRAPLAAALEDAKETVKLVAGLTAPEFEREPRMVALHHPKEYPYNHGHIQSTDGVDLRPSDWDRAFREMQVEGSMALHARTKDGATYLLGPASRITLDAEQLHPIARELLAETGMADAIRTNIYWSVLARAIELTHAIAEAIDIVDGYRPPIESRVAWTPKSGVAAWSTEAPRGLLFHRYEIDDRGRISAAQIVPPTSQNQGAIEDDLRRFAPRVIDLPDDEATLRLEQLIRSYDPCISCATHFLDVRILRD